MRLGRFGIALVLFGLLLYLTGLLVHLPAAQAWRWFGSQVPVQAFGLSGSIWSGQAAVVLQEPMRLNNVGWQLDPLRLLTGRLGGELRADAADGEIRAQGSVTRDDADADLLRADLPMNELLRWLNSPMLPAEAVDGRLQAHLTQLAVRDRLLRRAEGVINWQGARLRMGPGLNLGDLTLRLQVAEQGTRGVISNSDSALEIAGELDLNQQGGFTLQLDLRPTDQASRQALSILGPGDEGGTRSLRVRGRMSPDGIQLEPLNQG